MELFVSTIFWQKKKKINTNRDYECRYDMLIALYAYVELLSLLVTLSVKKKILTTNFYDSRN